MPDLAGLQNDPRFKALPPDRQQALLAHMGGGATPSEGIGQKIGRIYREDIAKPATEGVARSLTNIGQSLTQGPPTPEQYAAELGHQDYTPYEKLPAWAREVSEFVVPQTATSAAITGASFALPEAGAAKVLGEAAGPVERMLGSRLARIGAGTAIGAGAGALSGEGAGQGALTGAGAMIPGEALGAGAGILGRNLGEDAVNRETTKQFGKAIGATIPWAGKMERGSDFADAFVHGKAVNRARDLLGGVKETLGRRAMGYHFDVPVPTAQGIERRPMSFADADKLITELQQGYGFSLGGDERSGANARAARALSYRIRDEVADGLNKIPGAGKLGDAYLKARKQFDAAMTLNRMFDKRDLIGPQGLNQSKLIDRMNEYAPDLDRSLGQGTSKRLLGVLRRGFIGEGKDIPSKPGRGHLSLGLFPHYSRITGHGFDPVGEVPGYIRPSGAPIEGAISNAIGKANAPQRGDAAKTLDRARAESIAPTPDGADRAQEVSKKLARGGEPPDVHADLNHGRLSLDELKKVLGHANKTDAGALLDNVPLEEAMSAVEVGSPEEKRMLIPILQQKLRAEMANQKGNRTAQAKLAMRMKRLMDGAGDNG